MNEVVKGKIPELKVKVQRFKKKIEVVRDNRNSAKDRIRNVFEAGNSANGIDRSWTVTIWIVYFNGVDIDDSVFRIKAPSKV